MSPKYQSTITMKDSRFQVMLAGMEGWDCGWYLDDRLSISSRLGILRHLIVLPPILAQWRPQAALRELTGWFSSVLSTSHPPSELSSLGFITPRAGGSLRTTEKSRNIMAGLYTFTTSQSVSQGSHQINSKDEILGCYGCCHVGRTKKCLVTLDVGQPFSSWCL